MSSTQTDPVTMQEPAAVDNTLDDIFGSSPPHESARIVQETQPEAMKGQEPSDLPSMRRQHVTAGYRDGISASKGEHVQNGFDAGFPVGAQLGMRAGTVLGIMEGVLRGYESRASAAVVKKQPQRGAAGGKESEEAIEARRVKREQILKLYRSAVKELDVQAVFAGMGGTLGNMMEPQEPRDNEGEEESAEDQLARKGGPVVSQWEDRVMVAHWEQNMDALEEKEKEGEDESNEQS
ncbi:hypothetical protein ASPWEDRAFT_173527 [Aspergillus wentii DTO 134E9]|uniref:Protein YAE1 n=1 Tax=Aspergillus wentii DTO 134E9 TaxID=1073089 RepID=A0A1L9RGN1_ASPWE|nr:uncharacterized protein ASPWEDRAFT_173527 [Aspergillus wentii DTO 134E9]KAI9927875.1 Essential protein Yae1, N terminal [Aspergillus wentii]OJJ34096.1 hypothetical protein ASPWEDRAFT_173527 [Aspergillus wentii DTO 134E9]